MSVLFETSFGDITIDLYTKECPNTCKNFIKLCKIKFYDHCLFYNIQKDFTVQIGDHTATGLGGVSIEGYEINVKMKLIFFYSVFCLEIKQDT